MGNKMTQMGCKEYSERLIFFDDLEESEKEIVQYHLNECRKCQVHYNDVITIMRSLKNTNHLSNELLTRFIISQNFLGEADYDGEKLSKHKIQQAENHLEACLLCRERFDEMKTEFGDLESYVNESIDIELDLRENLAKKLLGNIQTKIVHLKENWKGILTSPQQKFLFISAGSLAIVLIMLLLIPFSRNSDSLYHKLGKLENTEIAFLTRSAGVDNVQSGLSEFNNGKYSLAVEELESFILEHPDDPNREIAEYVCGLAYLFLANGSLGESDETLQNENIENGIKHLQIVLSMTENKRFQEDCNWYIGKAYLMKREGPNAIEYFEKVVSLKGRKFQKAREILAELKK
jgi:tetratricopeptide (TPR) repeat protein